MTSFRYKWESAVNNKDSVLCAGLDPADFEMERGEKGLPLLANKRDRALKYIEAVAPFCSATKFNTQYWKGDEDAKTLKEIYELSHSLGMVVIEDSKLPDIGATNEAGMFYASKRADAVTFSPFPGNLEEAAVQAKKWKIGLISMVLMSNPEYEKEKNKLVEIDEDDNYHKRDVEILGGRRFVKQYVHLAKESAKNSIEGIVVGAPSKDNHITEQNIIAVRGYFSCLNSTILMPEIGTQKGDAEVMYKHFGKEDIIANIGRELMFPEGCNSTSEQQAKAAKFYRNQLNELTLGSQIRRV